jgi:CHAT domain-containing protein
LVVTGHQLWRVLIPPPVREQVLAADEVVVVPDGALHAFPMEALVLDPTGPVYWLDEGPPVRTAHSLTSLLALRDRTPAPARSDTVLTLSDPTFASDGDARAPLPRLPATREESRAIRTAFGAARVVSLTGDDAAESRLKAHVAHARYVHLATHGLVDETGPQLLASLALAAPTGGDEEDGYLHLFEIYELDLRCELAVLSACETKRGQRIEGEGVFALSRGFLSAGAQRTVASLWAVADESTAALMAEFFEGIAAAERRGGPIPYARLLFDAKRALRATGKWSHPFYWAPFVLTGIQG